MAEPAPHTPPYKYRANLDAASHSRRQPLAFADAFLGSAHSNETRSAVERTPPPYENRNRPSISEECGSATTRMSRCRTGTDARGSLKGFPLVSPMDVDD